MGFLHTDQERYDGTPNHQLQLTPTAQLNIVLGEYEMSLKCGQKCFGSLIILVLLVLLSGVFSPAYADMAYIANWNSNNVSVIDTSNNSVVATLAVGRSPQGIAVNPSGTRVYVTNSGSNPDSTIVDGTVSVIDIGNNSVVATVTVGNTPQGIAVNPSGTRVYVANASIDLLK